MNWIRIEKDDTLPKEYGHYAVMIAGDSETLDGYTLYDYPDYMAFALWVPAEEDEYEDFEGGYKGSWHSIGGDNEEYIFAWYGPLGIPKYE